MGKRNRALTFKTFPGVEPGWGNVGDPNEPYRKLLTAILYRAIVDAVSPEADLSRYRRHLPNHSNRDAAIDWFRHPGNEPFSFRWIMQHLDLDESMLKKLLAAAKRRELQWRNPYQ